MKEKVTVTAKVQIYLGEQERKQVVATGCLYCMACNDVSRFVFPDFINASPIFV